MSLDRPCDYALRYAQLGWHVFPLMPGTKEPLAKLAPHSHHNATTDPTVILNWWMREPNANIGIALSASSLLAVDVDPRKGGDVQIEELESRVGPIASDVLAYTGGGGEHRVFAVPAGVKIAPPAHLEKCEGLDLKYNGYIVVEPSIHPFGTRYNWEASSSPLDGVLPSPLLPWMQDRFRVSARTALAVELDPADFADLENYREAISALDADDRACWIQQGHRLKAIGTDAAFAVWDEWSQSSDKYDAADCRYRWDSFKPTVANPQAILRDAAAVHAKAAGVDVSGLTKPKESTRIEAPRPLPPELLPVDTFPLSALPEAFGPWVRDVAERMHCSPDYVAVPMLVAAASLVARHVGIRPQRRTTWCERGNLWGLIVGRPGLMKSPGMSEALVSMDRLEARAAAAFNDEAAQHQAEAMAVKLRTEAKVKTAKDALKKNSRADVTGLLLGEDEIDEPIRRRYVVNDSTYEKLGDILVGNPDGVLAVRDEVRGLFLSLAREEAAPARAFYLQAWSGGSYTFDRIGRGTVTVADARLSIIGGIQPGPLCDLVQQARRGAADDGMIERFLIAWPDAQGEWREVDRWPDTTARQRVWGTFDRLDAITADALHAERELDVQGEPCGLPFLRFDDDARDAFGEWRREFEQTLRTAEGEGLEGALSKFRHHVPALALAMHVIDGGTGPVTLSATSKALMLAKYFESHARRLHSSGRRIAVRAARTIIDKARDASLPDPFTARDVYRPRWTGLADRAGVADALDLLCAHGWLTENTIETGGRPTAIYGLTEGARHG